MKSNWDYCYYYGPEDFPLAADWCKEHGRQMVREEWLSDTGFILRNPHPVIFFWMYLDPSCSVAFIDWVITRPGTPLSVLKEGIVYALWGPMRETLVRYGKDTVISRSPAAMARVMERAGGWHAKDEKLMSMSHVFTPEELQCELAIQR